MDEIFWTLQCFIIPWPNIQKATQFSPTSTNGRTDLSGSHFHRRSALSLSPWRLPHAVRGSCRYEPHVRVTCLCNLIPYPSQLQHIPHNASCLNPDEFGSGNKPHLITRTSILIIWSILARPIHVCIIKVKLFLCFNWAPRHEGVLGEWRYSVTHSLAPALDGVSGQLHASAALPQGKSPWYPLNRRLAGKTFTDLMSHTFCVSFSKRALPHKVS
jgi:hypothetical protein